MKTSKRKACEEHKSTKKPFTEDLPREDESTVLLTIHNTICSQELYQSSKQYIVPLQKIMETTFGEQLITEKFALLSADLSCPKKVTKKEKELNECINRIVGLYGTCIFNSEITGDNDYAQLFKDAAENAFEAPSRFLIYCRFL